MQCLYIKVSMITITSFGDSRRKEITTVMAFITESILLLKLPCKLKWGEGDGEWGTYDDSDYDDQLWKLVP